MLLIEFALDVEGVRDWLEGDLGRSVHLDTEEKGAPLLCLEYSRFFRNDVQHGVVSHRLVDKWNIDSSRQLLVNVGQLCHQVGFLVSEADQAV